MRRKKTSLSANKNRINHRDCKKIKFQRFYLLYSFTTHFGVAYKKFFMRQPQKNKHFIILKKINTCANITETS